MKQFNKVCKVCGCSFIGSGPAAMYCPEHLEQRRQEVLKQSQERTLSENTGIYQEDKDAGCRQGRKPFNKQRRTHRTIARILRPQSREIKERRRYCERCAEDLLHVSRWHWAVHHKDHNHSNHSYDNLELLCKRCHQVEHECHKAFTKGATTIPKGSRLKRAEAPDTPRVVI